MPATGNTDAQPHLSTALFADLCGSARLHERLADSEAQRAVDRCLKRIERSIEAYDGKIVRTGGDEVLAVFELADSALHAALEMQQRVADLPAVSGVKLEIRVGFAHGCANIDDAGDAAVGIAAHLTGLAKPGQTLTSLHSCAALSRTLQPSLREIGSAPAAPRSRATKIFEVVAPQPIPPGGAEVAAASAANAQFGSRLLLRYAGETIVLDELRPLLVIGRDADSGFVIKGKRASRSHARIERRADKFVLIDASTNGTYLTLAGEREVTLRRQEHPLHGKGCICLAASATRVGVDRVDFEEL